MEEGEGGGKLVCLLIQAESNPKFGEEEQREIQPKSGEKYIHETAW